MISLRMLRHVLCGLAIIWGTTTTAVAENFATRMMDCTFKLFHPTATSTCFLLSDDESGTPKYLVTTGHTLERVKGDSVLLVLRQPMPEGAFQRLDFRIPIRIGDQPLWEQHPQQDVAVLLLRDELPVPVKALPRALLANAGSLATADLQICSPLYLFTYPERFEANAAAFPVARHGIFSSPPQMSAQAYPRFIADFTTFSGDSGGPVFVPTQSSAEPLIVGMVLGRYFHDEKITTEYGRHLVKHPLGLGIVLHAVYISETIDQLSKETK